MDQTFTERPAPMKVTRAFKSLERQFLTFLIILQVGLLGCTPVTVSSIPYNAEILDLSDQHFDVSIPLDSTNDGARFLLTNATSAPGDNELIVASANAFSPRPNLLQSPSLRLPPFEELLGTDFNVMRDRGGKVLYVSSADASGATCVLAHRRVSTYPPQGLPFGLYDITMRNCVKGSATKALKPIVFSTAVFE